MINIKITIDTKEDSHEEIKKIIKMLSSLVGENEILENRNIFDNSDNQNLTENNVFGNMFADNEPKTDEETNDQEPKTGETKAEEDIARIIEYD